MSDAAKGPIGASAVRYSPTRYSAVAIALHWTIALAIVLQIILAGRMDGPPTPESFAVTQLHKSIGITILLLSLLRLGWRLGNPPPPEPATLATWERRLSQATHWGFYAVMIGMPLTGWLMVSASRTQIPTLLYGVVHWPNLPGFADLAPAAKKAWHSAGVLGHGTIAKVIYVLLALHVAGALKHQLLGRDEPVLSRMAPGAVAGRWLEPRIAVIAAAFLGVIAFGRMVQPPRPAIGPPPAPASVATEAAPAPTPAAATAPAVSPAATPAAAPSSAAPAGPVAWRVAAGSTLSFITSWSGDAVQGRFERWTANIVFSPDALDKSKVSVSIDMASAKTGDDQRDASLPAPDWFDSAAHPKAVFAATKFEKTGADRYVAHGTLNLRGVTKPVDLPFRLTITGDKAKVSGETSLDRTLFGVGQGEFTATDQIPAKVGVRVELTATRDQR
jgi:cytochrome b561/polyisoprenoid-binding protein YceI